MQFEKVTYIAVPQKYGQKKVGVEEGPKFLEKLGFMNILEQVAKNINKKTITEPKTPQELGVTSARNLNEVESVCIELRDTISKEYDVNNLLINIGGDHSIGLGTIAGVVKAMKPNAKVGVIWFDAHPDMNIPENSPSGNIHGMPLACAVGLGPQRLTSIMPRYITPKDIMYVGIRSIDVGEEFEIQDKHIDHFTAEDVKRVGMKEVIEAINKKFADYDVIHLSFDIDGIDPKFILGTGTPVPKGISLEDSLYFMSEMGKMKKLHSVDIVEYNPKIEEEITGKNVLKCISSLFGIKC
ncbi:arginase, putative [Entamoeba dispar SAW760]|uniref:Arginase n=1 Tax=Entamoeba dispar (strain ATCC PRA-260 / SAW760) TaxID=370354 RepID=B0E9F1_ENTDS|nr:arginase, putative [Entamoeba dispar SAW760]EDR28860.1 arginase, putative [Entamoeba dispar SAW760]|eukprot:EDR28860.1 arginase, putative [Entamoeba dispar SAW760]